MLTRYLITSPYTPHHSTVLGLSHNITVKTSSDKTMTKERLTQIEKKIGEKPVFVISKSYCPFCKKAKQVLKKYNIKPERIEIMEIDNDEDCNEIQVKLALR